MSVCLVQNGIHESSAVKHIDKNNTNLSITLSGFRFLLTIC